jgi:hypothetical protein
MAEQTEGDEPVPEQIEFDLVLRDLELPDLVSLEVLLQGTPVRFWSRPWEQLRGTPQLRQDHRVRPNRRRRRRP